MKTTENTQLKHGSLMIDGNCINYSEIGHGPVMLVISEEPGTQDYWDNKKVVTENFRIIEPDLRNFHSETEVFSESEKTLLEGALSGMMRVMGIAEYYVHGVNRHVDLAFDYYLNYSENIIDFSYTQAAAV